MIPFVVSNFNAVELGPRGTGQSHLFQQISPYAHLVSGGKATVATMFVNNNTGRRGLVAQYDVVCFDEVSGVSFDQKDGVNILEGYMESGEFFRPALRLRERLSCRVLDSSSPGCGADPHCWGPPSTGQHTRRRRAMSTSLRSHSRLRRPYRRRGSTTLASGCPVLPAPQNASKSVGRYLMCAYWKRVEKAPSWSPGRAAAGTR